MKSESEIMATKRYKLKKSAVPVNFAIESLKNRTGFEVDPDYLYPEECDLVRALKLNDALDEFEEFIYESDLPKSLSKEAYDTWYAKSEIIDGVRMGPPVSCEGVIELNGLTKEESEKLETAKHICVNGQDFISKEYAVDLCARFYVERLSNFNTSNLSEELKTWRKETGCNDSVEIVHFIISKLIK